MERDLQNQLRNCGRQFMRNWKPVKGMEVYVVPDDGRNKPYASVVESVGRKYFTVNSLKFDLIQKSRTEWPVATCYQSEEKYQESNDLYQKKLIIEQGLENLTAEQINTVYNWIAANVQP